MKKFYRRVRVGKTKTNNQVFFLSYYVTNKCVEIEGEQILTYGVSITKGFLDDSQFIRWEKETVNNICLREDCIYEFIEKLCRNRVTPIHLLEIAEDYVAECEDAGISRPEGLKLVC